MEREGAGWGLHRTMGAGMGVLLHVTSLPGTGDDRLDAALRFIDGLADAGMRYWQVLPLNPVDPYGNPYASASAFACEDGLLGRDREGGIATDDPGFRSYREQEASWLEPYAAFCALAERFGGNAWQDWPDEHRRFDPQGIAADPGLARAANARKRAQYAFQLRWSAVRAHAAERGVAIVGDLPIYVSAESADTWAHPGLFQLRDDGRPGHVAGCPPDAFAPEGQIWNNPLYDWDAMAADGYRWWVRRLRRACELYDIVRIDHFIGFARYFGIPAGRPAAEGTYRPGPGAAPFRAAHDVMGPLPVVAEDLGNITDEVRALLRECGFPGMQVVQFADGDPLQTFRPPRHSVAYTGTHDNQTLVGFAHERFPHRDAREVAGELLRAVASCEAAVRVFSLQDLAGLDDCARMNTPGTTGGNWQWQATAEDVARALERAATLAAV